MNILHIVPGLSEPWNGIAVAAKRLADYQRCQGHEVELTEASTLSASDGSLSRFSECWVHSMWIPPVWRACRLVLGCRASIGVPRLVRMTHANLDPLRYRYHGWKKRLVTPVERWLFSKTDRVVTTGEWETAWCRQWGLRNDIEVVSLLRCFNVDDRANPQNAELAFPLHVLYLGRRHPLKGVGYLERAVRAVNGEEGRQVDLRVESRLSEAEKEAAWDWCDVLCLPTLSENFGLVVAEALERGKRVITTDGAPAWESFEDRIIYIRGYRDGTDESRVQMLINALERVR